MSPTLGGSWGRNFNFQYITGMAQFYQLTPEAVVQQLKTSTRGLHTGQILALQTQHGKNVLQEPKRKSRFAIFFSQFKDVMILILMIAAGISFFVGENTDAFVILSIILGNALIGYFQEYNAEESVRMLQRMTSQQALVQREGNPIKIEASELVPGDIIILNAGDSIPADARLMSTSSIKVDESALTGESQSVEKITEPLSGDNLSPGDQLNMLFKGTIISNGTGKAIVTAIGMNTEIGKIAGLLNVENQQTPLQKRLSVFSRQLAVVVVVICVIVFLFGLWRGEPSYTMFFTALSLAVAALPEALPAVVTIALAQGARRMVKQNALVRKLPAVETLGSVTYICSDKTGTLTKNVMTVEKMESIPDREPLLLQAMMLNNDVRYAEDGSLLGDSTETALVRYAIEHGLNKDDVFAQFPLIEKIPFNSDRMRMGTLHQNQDKWILFVKGAPGKIIEVLSAKHKDQIAAWTERNREWASEGLRILFFACKEFDEIPAVINESLESELDYLGIIAMIDPPREEVIDAIQQCKTAGIKTVMITGDQPLTAYAIAQRLKIIDQGAPEARTGASLEDLSEEEFNKQVIDIPVFARVSPEQKLSIVKALQHHGEFVAMTGDGVNDAPSLKQADIGIAMGITGTDVSKEAADMILLDDNFATIIKSVKEGRRIYENIKKFILYVLSCNLAEIMTIFLAPILGFAIPLLPTHILWINLVTDGLPGLALVAEPAEKDIMKRPPIPPKEHLFAGGLIGRILITGSVMTAAALFIQFWAVQHGYEVRMQQSMVFTTLCFVQLGNALSVRMVHQTLFSSKFFSNKRLWLTIGVTIILQLLVVYVPFFQNVFKTESIPWKAMQMILIVILGSLMMFEFIKFLKNRFPKKGV
ncbi:MAG: cation-translocating P-type ATPase [Bacteroidota bacterium]|nr:cation-translocating P-type ATPase [Bacteroidota bacterium]